MRYKALAAFSLLGGYVSGEEIDELTTIRREHNSMEINFQILLRN